MAKRILKEAQSRRPATGHVEETILGNEVIFQLIESPVPSNKKVLGIAVNQNTLGNILENARLSLADRIETKAKICSSLRFHGPLWLARLNRYWLADAKTYKQALTGVGHPTLF